MNADDLTTEQARQLKERVRTMLAYLTALRNRIEQRRFPPSDKLRQLVESAHDSVQHLHVELHYLSCNSGVGKPPRR